MNRDLCAAFPLWSSFNRKLSEIAVVFPQINNPTQKFFLPAKVSYESSFSLYKQTSCNCDFRQNTKWILDATRLQTKTMERRDQTRLQSADTSDDLFVVRCLVSLWSCPRSEMHIWSHHSYFHTEPWRNIWTVVTGRAGSRKKKSPRTEGTGLPDQRRM